MTEVSTVREALTSIYEEIMWLSHRPNVTPGQARSWYTHVMAESVKRRVRRFTGLVSREAVTPSGAQLMLEHYMRIQTELTQLVARHRAQSLLDPEEFVELILEYEQVHVVTRAENYAAMRAKGDYEIAGIELVPWTEIATQRRHELWTGMLRGRVANADAFRS